MRKVKEMISEFDTAIKAMDQPKTAEEADALWKSSEFSSLIHKYLNEILVDDFHGLRELRSSEDALPGVMREVDARYRSWASQANQVTWNHLGFRGISEDGALSWFNDLLTKVDPRATFDRNFNIVPKPQETP